MSSSTLSSHCRTILIETGSQSQSQLHPQSQQSGLNQSSNQEYLVKLKQSLLLSKEQLIQLTNRNEFSDRVFCFNNQAKKLIETNKIQQALVYLNEAQKILEYAASSGKNISRKRIVQVLHNQACSYQILWDLEKCSNYIQALIFNFNSELKFGQFPHSTSGSEIHISSSKKSLGSQSRIEKEKIQKKIHLVKYYLLYCAINSQLKNNQGALVAAKKASEITKGVMQQLLDIYEQQKQSNPLLTQSLPPFVYSMLQEIPKINTSITTNKTQDLLMLTRHYIKVYNSKCVFNNLSSSKGFQSQINSKEVYQKYKDFSIGNIMQLQPIGDTSESQKTVQDSCLQPNSQRINYDKLIEKLIVFSICQFTMATQLRYIALNNAKNDKQKSYQMLQFKESQTYHLLSILIVAMYMPFDIIYMEHIISSYHGHYKTVLLSNGLDGTPQLTEDQIKRIRETVVFAHKASYNTSSSSRKEQDLKKCSTTNQSNSSLIVSFHEQDQESDSHQLSSKKSKQSSHVKSKQSNNHSFVNENDISNEQKHLFDEYYYVKKDTENDHGETLAYEDHGTNFKKQHSTLMKNVKSKSKTKKSSKKNISKRNSSSNRNSKSRSKINISQSVEETQNQKENLPSKRQPRQSQFRPQPTVFFQSKPSTLLVLPSQHSKELKYSSQRTSHGIHSPGVVPEIYSKITKSKQSRSKQSKKKSSAKTQTFRQQSEYFNKCNVNKKSDNNRASKHKENVKPGKEKKSKSNKKNIEIRKQDAVKTEYFQAHDMNVIKGQKMGNKKSIYNEGDKKSVSKGKKQRLSSKSLTRTISPNGLTNKLSNMKNITNNKPGQQSKQKRMRHTEGLASIYVRSGVSNGRSSVSNKKSQRMTIQKLGDRLKTEESGSVMKGSHFNNYYL